MAQPDVLRSVVGQFIARDDERLKMIRWYRRRASERQGLPLDPDDAGPMKPPEMPEMQPVPVEVQVKHTHERTTTVEPAPDRPAAPEQPAVKPFDWCRLAALLLIGLGLIWLGMLFAGAWRGGDTIITPTGSESLLQWLEDEKKHLP